MLVQHIDGNILV